MGLLDKLFPPPGRDRFARLMIDALRKRGEAGDVEYDAKDFRLLMREAGGGRDTFFLSNAYNDFVAAPRGARGEVIERYASLRQQTAPAAEKDYASARSILLPRVRERFYHESLRLMMRREGKGPEDSFVNRPLNDDLSLELVLDLPDSILTVNPGMLKDWGVTFDDALAVAKDNLWKKSNENFLRLRPGLYRSPWADTHDASRLFLHDLVWQLEVKGNHVAMVPNRDLLLVCGSDDADGLLAMAGVAEAVLQENRPMTGLTFRLEGSRWVPFLPPEGSPAHWPLRKVAMRSRGMEYGEQGNLLEALHEKTGRDVFVAKQRVIQRDDGTWFSGTTWVDGVTDALMPEADFVSFARVGGVRAGPGKLEAAGLGYATWEAVRAVAGGLLEPTELYPPRYRVTTFPGEEQLRQLQLRPAP